jgi:hypothetical protein
MQAQVPSSPYWGLLARLDGFRPDALAGPLADRRLVRVALMRGTIHLVGADDALRLRPLVQRVFDRDLATNSTYARPLKGMDLDALAAAGRELVDERPRTMGELRRLLAERWPGRDPASLAYAVRNLLPLVQVPPRGIWGASGQPTLTTAQAWLGRPLGVGSGPAIDELVVRYLAAFGPASVADVQTWTGLTGLGEVLERLGPHLRRFADGHGRVLFDLPDAPRPDPDTPAPPRLLPDFDNLLLSHADRTRFGSGDHRRRLSAGNMARPAVLVDGVVGGHWRLETTRAAATLRVELFEPIGPADAAMLADEGALALAFAAPDAATSELQFHPQR